MLTQLNWNSNSTQLKANSKSTQTATTSYLNIGKELKFTCWLDVDNDDNDNNNNNSNGNADNHTLKGDW